MHNAIILSHAMHETPGFVLEACARRGVHVEERRLDAGDAVPDSIADNTLLVVMGGPMSVGDVGGDRYPFLAKEVSLLRARIARDTPVLGICLGAQLIAHAAGARVFQCREREVGWGPVDFHLTSGDRVLAGIGSRETMLHWHGDTFDLPIGATRLASTPLCPNQAFRLGRAIGFQFHCEVDAPAIDRWLEADADYVRESCGADGARRIRLDTETYARGLREVGLRLLDNVLGALSE